MLRQEYIKADFGMSGGNFMIAETGTVAIVTNEGNGRLSTGMPPVHIAVVGIEKVIPTWEDFATLVQLLPRPATGQRLTVYVNMFNGPARSEEPDGPQEFYLILLDNGRSNIYGSEYSEALACIRCGACLNVCPVYQNVGGHTYGSVYPGPIGAVITPLLHGKENASPLPFASSLCGACKAACPVDINIPDMLIGLRRDLQDVQDPIWQVGMKACGFGFSHPLLFEMGGKVASAVTHAISNEGRASPAICRCPIRSTAGRKAATSRRSRSRVSTIGGGSIGKSAPEINHYFRRGAPPRASPQTTIQRLSARHPEAPPRCVLADRAGSAAARGRYPLRSHVIAP